MYNRILKAIFAVIISLTMVMSCITPMHIIATEATSTIEEAENSESEMESMSPEEWHDYRVWLLKNVEYKESDSKQTHKSNLLRGNNPPNNQGNCGENVSYLYDDKTQTLNITGTGKMNDYSYGNSPWNSYKNDIRTVNIADGITYIGRYAFYQFESLYKVTGMNDIQEIGYMAFGECSNLTSINIPESVNALYQPFYKCLKLKEIKVDEKNKYYKDIDGVLYDKQGTLLYYPSDKSDESYEVPVSTKSIEDYAFAYNTHLVNPVIPNNCKLGKGIFYETEFIKNWYTKNYATYYWCTGSVNNNCLIINNTLISIHIDNSFPLQTLDFTQRFSNSNGEVTISRVDLMDYKYKTNRIYKPYEEINKILSEPYIEIQHDCLEYTTWYSNDISVIYNNENEIDSSYRFLYKYNGNAPSFNATNYTHIGANAFSLWAPKNNATNVLGKIYICSNTTLNEDSLKYADIEDIYVCSTPVDSIPVDLKPINLNYIKIPSKKLSEKETKSQNIDHSVAIADENNTDYTTFKYELALAVINNSKFFDKLASAYCDSIIKSFKIDQHKTNAQKAQEVYYWMRSNFDYAEWDMKDEDGNHYFNEHKYSKSFELTHTKAALLLTDFGVCSAFSELFQYFMDKLSVPSIIISNNGCVAEDTNHVGQHAWNLVQIDNQSNTWYYMDSSTRFSLVGQEDLKRVEYVGFRQRDAESNPHYIRELLESYNKYGTITISKSCYEPVWSTFIKLDNSTDENHYVSLSSDNNLFNMPFYDNIVHIFGEDSLYKKGVSICVNNIPIYTFNSHEDIELSDKISGKYTLPDNYTVSYEIRTKEDGIYIYVFDDESIFVDFDDKTALGNKYIIETNNTQTEYDSSACVRVTDGFTLTFCKSDYSIIGSIITNDSFKSFTEELSYINDENAAYKLSCEKKNVIKFMAYSLGDINTDGKINNKDAMILQSYLIKGYQFIQTGCNGDLLIEIENVTINGDMSANGELTINATNANINGTLNTNNFINNVTGNLNMKPISDEPFNQEYITSILSYDNMINYYFNNAKPVNQSEVYDMLNSSNQSTADFNNPLICDETLSVSYKEGEGNVKIHTNICAENGMSFKSKVFNMENTVLYSEFGDIIINATNFNFDGLIYAPNGRVIINALNQNITGTIIADSIEIKGKSNVNFTVAAQSVLKSITDEINLTNYQLMIADVNKDEKLNIIDFLTLKRRISEKV